jgi:hypothetical protein
MEQWVWAGHAGHLCVVDDCRFHMATRVGMYVVSTVGDYYPPGRGVRDTIGAGEDSFFETFVFPATGEELDCGCPEVESFGEIDGERYADAKAATDGHMRYCRKYADQQ